MEKNEIFSLVQKNVVEIMGLDESEISLASHFINDLGCDSILLTELIMVFEYEFGLQISDKEAEKFSTIENVVDYIYDQENLR